VLDALVLLQLERRGAGKLTILVVRTDSGDPKGVLYAVSKAATTSAHSFVLVLKRTATQLLRNVITVITTILLRIVV
jgi:hypothetical protein